MAKPKISTVKEYLNAQPPLTRKVLQRVRAAMRRALPKAQEVISYQIPAFKIDADVILYYAGWKAHYSIYPADDRMVERFKRELEPYEIRKGTVRFPLDEPVPEKLIERMARFRARAMK